MQSGASVAKTPGTDWADWLDSYEGLPAFPALAAPPKTWLESVAGYLPGLSHALAPAVLAHYFVDWTGRYVLRFAKSPIGAIPVAILMGVALRRWAGLPRAYEDGLKLCVRTLLRLGIVLLGLRLSLPAVGSIGLSGLPVVVCCIATALAVVWLLARLLGLSMR